MKDLFKSLPLAAVLCVFSLVGTVSAQTPGATRGEPIENLISTLKTSGNSHWRTVAAKELAQQVSNEAARKALTEALLNDENDLVQMTASRALAPYVNEPQVKEAFLKSLENNDNDVVRMTTTKALAHNIGGDREARELFIKIFKNDRNEVVRSTIVKALDDDAGDPAPLRPRGLRAFTSS